MRLPTFINATGKLRGDDAVAALLVMPDGSYVMQLRDDIPQIFYPDHWGCFGGAVNSGEEPLHALHRELGEELEFEAGGAQEFTRFDFDFRPLGKDQQQVYRIYYEVPVTDEAFSKFVLHEGAQFKRFSGAEILCQQRVTPYDAFAIWMHLNRSRFA
jgi:8-oxo-dGTP pyrophosphatase MutT (NUDIX family)